MSPYKSILLLAFSLAGLAANAYSQRSLGAGGGAGGVPPVENVTQTVAPGETYTAPDGTTVSNNGTKPSDPVVEVKTFMKNNEPLYTHVNPRRGANFKATGLDECEDAVNIPLGNGTTADLNGHDYTVNVEGSKGEITVNGNNTHVNAHEMGKDNEVFQNGNGSLANYGGSGANTVTTNGDNNLYHNSNTDNNLTTSGTNNQHSGDPVDTRCK